jgi:hypothetical protein
LKQLPDLTETEGGITVHECDSCKEKFASPEDFILQIENSHKEANVMFLG